MENTSATHSKSTKVSASAQERKGIFALLMKPFLAFDRKMDGAASFFFRHWGKTKFMIAMSKKAQVLGVERLYLKSPKAFLYFFLFYLVRDTILYIIIPIYFAKTVGN